MLDLIVRSELEPLFEGDCPMKVQVCKSKSRKTHLVCGSNVKYTACGRRVPKAISYGNVEYVLPNMSPLRISCQRCVYRVLTKTKELSNKYNLDCSDRDGCMIAGDWLEDRGMLKEARLVRVAGWLIDRWEIRKNGAGWLIDRWEIRKNGAMKIID